MLPLISCITPCHRVDDYDNLYNNFISQTYPNKELIVVIDDGMPYYDAENVVCSTVPCGTSIGVKRNVAASISSGSLIAHLDSDDHYDALWLEVMHSQMASGCDITGLDRAIFEAEGKKYLYEYSGAMPYVLGATMIYNKAAWDRNKFKDISEGEDAIWLGNAGRCVPARGGVGSNLFTAKITGHNTCSHKALNRMIPWQE